MLITVDRFSTLNLKGSTVFLSGTMDVLKALRLVDQLVFEKTGKYLNDLERRVFIGSWNGQTYEKIHPTNPEYLEKTVGYLLWQKLSDVLGEKVTKKRIRGAVERLLLRRNLVFISYRGAEIDQEVANQLKSLLQEIGYICFMRNLDEILTSPSDSTVTNPPEIDWELKLCQSFILILSAQSAVSEMMLEQLKRLYQWRDTTETTPQLLGISIGHIGALPLSHDVRHYLKDFLIHKWPSSADYQAISPWLKIQLQSTSTDSDSPYSDQDAIEQTDIEGSHSRISSASVEFPMPTAEPEIPQGQVRLASTLYIERPPYELQCYEAIARPGALIRLKAPRQMGKTSLMARILNQATERGYQAIPISFQHADRHIFQDLGSLLQWFCTKVARKLHITPQIEDHWVDTYGSKDNCTAYFEDYIFPKIKSPLVLGLDEVDAVFQHPTIADDFFGLLRAWYEEASYGSDDSKLWEQLRLVVVHSTEVYLPLDVNQSPFNVGLPIELPTFTALHNEEMN
ncbi:MAG: AAA-like domain-containing protein [Elainellaceae cyanobacterium]